jgi:hypothetical protein
MLSRPCPHCCHSIEFFAPEWQAQRGSPTKVCPRCAGKADVQFKGVRFAAWLGAFFLLSSIAGLLMGKLLGISMLVAALPVTLVASLHVFRAE